MAENGAKEPISDLEIKICEQMEYYFGDHNLPRDKFLKEQIKQDEGWVSLETMITFNRLSRLTTDFDVIADALVKSSTGMLELSEDRRKVRRSPAKPLPEVTEEYKNAVKNRSVYVKGFPTDATFDEIKTWFDGKGQVESIQMRRTIQRAFKGSVFAVFDSNEAAKTFVEIPDQKYKDMDLIVLTKDNYFTKKNEERKQHRAEAKTKSKQAKEETQKKAEEDEMKSLDEKIGCLLTFSGDLDEQTSREDLHSVFATFGEIKWIDFSRGAKEGIILFKEKALEALEKAKAANDGNLQLRNKDVKWEVLEGEAEKEALKKIVENQQESLNKYRNKGRKFKGKGRGGGKGTQGSSQKRKVQFEGKKTKFESDEDDGDSKGPPSPKKEMNTDEKVSRVKTGNEPPSPKKRSLEESNASEEPASKQPKNENGGGDQ
ncbi:lupus La protein [Lissotriton helveticus]